MILLNDEDFLMMKLKKRSTVYITATVKKKSVSSFYFAEILFSRHCCMDGAVTMTTCFSYFSGYITQPPHQGFAKSGRQVNLVNPGHLKLGIQCNKVHFPYFEIETCYTH